VSNKNKIELINISAGYNESTVLAGISLEIPAGVFVLMGPSGGGKSTLLRLLNRLMSPTSGKILYNGAAIESYPVRELRKKIGMVFQIPFVFEGSVSDNLKFAEPDISDDRIAEILERVGLPGEYGSRNAGKLSVGEAQRVCLCRTLASKPKILLLDEPTSALDPTATKTIESLLLSFVPEISLVWVTHLVEQALRIGGNAAMLYNGKIRWKGLTMQLVNAEDEIVQKFVSGELK